MRRACFLVIAFAASTAAADSIGTAHPIRIDEHAPDGSWAIASRVDITTGAVTSLGADVSVWHQTGELAFVLEHATETSFVWNAATGARTAFPRIKDSFPDVGDGLAQIGGERYDWIHNIHIGKADEWIHASDTSGRVLVGPPQKLPNQLPDGPLHWETR